MQPLVLLTLAALQATLVGALQLPVGVVVDALPRPSLPTPRACAREERCSVSPRSCSSNLHSPSFGHTKGGWWEATNPLHSMLDFLPPCIQCLLTYCVPACTGPQLMFPQQLP